MRVSSEIKPRKDAFVYYALIKAGIAISIIMSVAYIVSLQYFLVSPLLFVLLGVALFALTSAYRFVVYSKETYVFYDTRVVRHSGGFFTNHETELVVKNFTHVKVTKPFFEYKLFRTGHVYIESAASGISEIHLASIDHPEHILSQIEMLMKENGFSLTKKKLLQQERPSMLGVFFEVFKAFWSTLLVFVLFGSWIFSAAAVVIHSSAIIVLLVFGALCALFIRSLLLFLDLRTRVYDIYSDVIIYREGFLSQHSAFIPIENLSDSTVTQSLADKLFGLYDVQVSCQGGGQEILFKNMAHGPELEKVIDGLIVSGKNVAGVAARGSASTAKIAHKSLKIVAPKTMFTGEYRMVLTRTLVPLFAVLPFCLVLFPLLIYWVPALIRAIIAVNSTTYIVKKKSMEERYNFMSLKHKEFTNDKIVGVIFKENFIDKWFGTWTVTFWSIGSQESISFRNIGKSDAFADELRAKIGVTSDKVNQTLHSRFSLVTFLKANIFGLAAIALLMGILFIAGLAYPLLLVFPIMIAGLIAAFFMYRMEYYGRSVLQFYPTYIYFKKGLFFVEEYYVLCQNVKSLMTLCYPASTFGSIQFDVAGQHLVQMGDRPSVAPNSFRIRYVEGIEGLDEQVDMLLAGKNVEHRVIARVRPDIGNTLAIYALIHIVFFPLLVLAPLTLPLVIFSVRMKEYVIDSYRAYGRSGIFYKRQVSVAFSKIDHINVHEGILNKMFGNKMITVNTTAGSKPELVIRNIADYARFAQLLKKD